MPRILAISLIVFAGFASATVVVSEEAASDSEVPLLQDSKLLGRDPEKPIAIMVAGQSILPAQFLLDLKEERLIRLKIESGPAYFLYRSLPGGSVEYLKEVSYRASRVRLPRVAFADTKLDFRILIEVDGRSFIDPIRVFSQEADVFELYEEMPSLAAAVLKLDRIGGYALIDEEKVEHYAVIYDYLKSEKAQAILTDEAAGLERAPIGEGGILWCPWETLPPPPSEFSNSDCTFFFGPVGIVYWQFFDPAGHGFSYKPEDDIPLRWATGSSDVIDGIYRTQWGCGVSLKVPDNVKLIARSPLEARCCRGPVAIVTGKSCRVVSTEAGAEEGWPDCPLG